MDASDVVKPANKEKKKKEKRKHKEKRKEDGTQSLGDGVAQPATGADETAVTAAPAVEVKAEVERSQQPGEDFRLAEGAAACSLDLAGPGKELCLLQLPLSWEDGNGTIQLPASGTELGSCRDAKGASYHVLDASGGAQLFAAAHGLAGPPLPVTRRFTLVSAEKLPQPLAAAEPDAEAAGGGTPTPRKEKADVVEGQPSNSNGPDTPESGGKAKRKRKPKRKKQEAAEAPGTTGQEGSAKKKKKKKQQLQQAAAG